MSASIVHAIGCIKRNVAHCLSEAAIEQACHEAGYRWRRRTLGPAQTVWAFALQVLHGNVACTHAVRLAQLTCSAAAYCDARIRLPLQVLQRIVELTSQAAGRGATVALWRGHRTWLVDGSSFSMPDTPALQARFGQSGAQQPGCGFPVAHLLALFDAASGLLLQAEALPLRTHDAAHLSAGLAKLARGDVLVGDRGFASYVHLALLLQAGLQGVFRIHQRQLVSFRRDRRLSGRQPKGTKATHANSRLIAKLGRFDQVVEYDKPATRAKWLTPAGYAALAETIRVRELRYYTKVRGFRTRVVTLVTTLLDEKLYPLDDMAELYRRRWEVETNFAHLKTTMHMDVLRCHTVEGVLKELAIYMLVYNLTRMVMLAGAKNQGVLPQRVSFVDALRWLAQACQGDVELELHVNGLRPHRIEPRAYKRRGKPYDLLNKPRRQLIQQLLAKPLTN